MKKFLAIPALFFLPLFLLTAQQPLDAVLQDIRVDVIYLASNYLEGRETGTEGERLAAQYIASRYAAIGLQPKGDNNTFFQEFPAMVKSHPHAEAGESRTARNVVGYIDNKAKQTVIIGAHYDHLGHGAFGSLHTGEPEIHNGADDNASGVAGLLRLAQALREKGAPRKNNYLFIAFSGEELGLYGSKFFVESAKGEWDKVNYMLNMDMIGRLDSVLVVGGVGTSPVWNEIMPGLAPAAFSVKTTESGMGPSDHAPFYLAEKPVLHFFTGQHSDYHKPSDDSEFVNFEGVEKIAGYMLRLIAAADAKGKLPFTKTKDEQEGRQAARFKVSLGVMPDYVYQGEGMRIDGVTDGRPGQIAGLRRGDILVQIGDMPVANIYDYMEGLSQFEKGQQSTLVVLRDGERLTLDVVF